MIRISYIIKISYNIVEKKSSTEMFLNNKLWLYRDDKPKPTSQW